MSHRDEDNRDAGLHRARGSVRKLHTARVAVTVGLGLLLAVAGCTSELGTRPRDAGASTDATQVDGAATLLDAATQLDAAATTPDAATNPDAATTPDAGPRVCSTAAGLVTPTDVAFGRIKPGAGVTQGFSGSHSGIDFAGGEAQVRASSDGFVVAWRNSAAAPQVASGFRLPGPASSGCWGNFVGIFHGTRSSGQGVVSWYGHLASADLAFGQSVERGDVVGTAGRSSYTSCGVSGVHLHYAVTLDGTIVDPTPYFGTSSGNRSVSMRWHWAPPARAVQQSIDRALRGAGYAAGSASYWQRPSIEAIQRVLTDHAGYTGPIDGTPNAQTAEYAQRFAAGCGGYTGPINAVPGTNTWTGFEAAVGAL